MSTIFEGVFFVASFEEVQSISSKISSPIKLKLQKINHYLCSFTVVENSRLFVSETELEYVASQISIIFHQSILVRYDNRVGYRESILFNEGILLKKFDLADELWVMLDEYGESITNGEKLSIAQIDDDDDEKEYETICNAIQLGLDSLGININIWKEVHSFMSTYIWLV